MQPKWSPDRPEPFVTMGFVLGWICLIGGPLLFLIGVGEFVWCTLIGIFTSLLGPVLLILARVLQVLSSIFVVLYYSKSNRDSADNPVHSPGRHDQIGS